MTCKDREAKASKSVTRQMLCDFPYMMYLLVRFPEIKKENGGCPGLGEQENRALLFNTCRHSAYKEKDSRRCAMVMAVPKYKCT